MMRPPLSRRVRLFVGLGLLCLAGAVYFYVHWHPFLSGAWLLLGLGLLGLARFQQLELSPADQPGRNRHRYWLLLSLLSVAGSAGLLAWAFRDLL